MRLHLARLDLVSLRLVVLCAEMGSLSGAARLVHLTVSSASHRLSALEEHVGSRLFERDPRGMRPTSAGDLVVAHSRIILEEVDRMQAQLLELPRTGDDLKTDQCPLSPM